MENEFPRRGRLDLNTPAELAIYNAMQEVENLDADIQLTNAVILLQQAKDLVADFIDKKPQKIEKYTSEWFIGKVKERFECLKHKSWDWRSFYNGWMEGRVDMYHASELELTPELTNLDNYTRGYNKGYDDGYKNAKAEPTTVHISFKDHDTVVLKNKNGDTYTSKSEDLIDFISNSN